MYSLVVDGIDGINYLYCFVYGLIGQVGVYCLVV